MYLYSTNRRESDQKIRVARYEALLGQDEGWPIRMSKAAGVDTVCHQDKLPVARLVAAAG